MQQAEATEVVKLEQLGDIGIAIDGVHATGGMPGGARGQFRPFDQHHIGPAELGEMVQHRTPDDTAADDDDPRMTFHENIPLGASDSIPKLEGRRKNEKPMAATKHVAKGQTIVPHAAQSDRWDQYP